MSARSSWAVPVLVGVVVLAGLLLLHIGTNGVGTGGDGPTYLDTADDVRDGRWYPDPDEGPATHYPPAYGTTIGLVSSILGVSLTTAAGLLNAAGWMATIAGAVALYRSLGGRANGFLWVLVLFLATSGVIVSLATSVLSESLFYASCIWFLVLVESYCRRPTGLLLAGLLAIGGYAFALRYPGITLIGAGSLRALQQSAWPWKVRLARGFAIAASGLPVLVWYLLVSGEKSGLPGKHDELTDGRGLDDLWNSVAALGSWFVGGVPFSEDEEIISAVADPVVRVATFTAGLLLVVTLAYLFWRWVDTRQADGRNLAGVVGVLRSARLLAIANFVVLYTAFILSFRLATGFYVLGRYWGPVAIVLAAAGLAFASRHATDVTKPSVRLLGLLLAAIVASNIVVSVALVYV